MNIFTLENLKRFESSDSSDSNVKPVEIIKTLGSYAIQISPERFYNRSVTPAECIKVFSDLFTLSPRWVFNLWIDNSSVVSSDGTTYDQGGFWVYYKNGTPRQLVAADVYDGTSTKAYKNVLFVSSESDAVSHIEFRYNYATPSYYRLDSTITPYTDNIKINKNGEIDVSSLFELYFHVGASSKADNAAFHVGGVVQCSTIVEY